MAEYHAKAAVGDIFQQELSSSLPREPYVRHLGDKLEVIYIADVPPPVTCRRAQVHITPFQVSGFFLENALHAGGTFFRAVCLTDAWISSATDVVVTVRLAV
jgi:hypothetical protein